jgi:hypothetical protein
MLSIDDTEARVSNRISVNNYLRVAGRELDLNVRTFGGMLQNQTTPNPIKPFVGQMVLAAIMLWDYCFPSPRQTPNPSYSVSLENLPSRSSRICQYRTLRKL